MSVLLVRCGKSTCDFVWKGPPSELDEATAAHRRAVAQAKAATHGAVGATNARPDAGKGAPADIHRPIVVGERWTRLEVCTAFNIAWIVMSFVTYASMSGGFFLLFFLFPQVATSIAQPAVPIVVMVAALCTATGYGMHRVKGARFWPRFFASLTMFGAVSAIASAGVGIAAFLFLSLSAVSL